MGNIRGHKELQVRQDAMEVENLAMDLKKINYYKAGFMVLLAVYGIVCAWDPTEQGMLDRVNLVIHEAGHLLFSWFGEFIGICGGTIGQLFVPVAFTVYFFVRREFFSSMVTLFWTGQNFFGISVYVKDAQAMDLPLLSIGGGDSIHDWNYILTRLGLLRWDHGIGNAIYILGIVIIAGAAIAGMYYSIEREEPAISKT
jgi:hypothetical protein